MTPDVEHWFAALTEDQRQLASALRDIVLSEAPALREEIKWNQPCYTGAATVCYIQKARGHVSLGFGKGAALADPGGLLEGTGAQMRHIRFRLDDTPDRGTLAGLIRAALVLDGG